MNKLVKLLIFDFDGTVADSIPLGFEIFQECAEQYHFRKMKNFTEYQELMSLSLPQILWRLRISPFTLKLIARQQKEQGIKRLLESTIFPGMPEVIQFAADHFKMALVSTNLQEAIEPFLEKYHLNQYFDVVLGAETSKDKKTKLKQCLAHFHVSHEETLMIGDSVRDVRDAKSAQIPILSVSYGIHTAEQLKKEKPTFLVHTPQEILPILESLSISRVR